MNDTSRCGATDASGDCVCDMRQGHGGGLHRTPDGDEFVGGELAKRRSPTDRLRAAAWLIQLSDDNLATLDAVQLLEKKATQIELVKAVRAHALQNYEFDGWDYVVEALDDAELIKIIGPGNTSVDLAIKRAHRWAKLQADVANDVRGEIF